MRFKILALGNKPPTWVKDGFESYAKRMPREMSLELVQIPPPKHHSEAARFISAEGDKMLAQVDNSDWVIALDERGKQVTSRQLAGRFEDWRLAGQDVVFVVGGSDGLAPNIKQRANETLSLSALTLPHYLVRPVLAEALYRAWSIYTKHPYHRE
ncbi:MAG: 23S rRNA (pseudouridine(1915)-N(3))-methyltransferase RlmH [Pseudomonadota bacterium]